MKRAIAILATAVMVFAGAVVGLGEEAERPLRGFFFAEARPWADQFGTFGDAWMNLGIGYQTHNWFANISMGYPSNLSLTGDWFVQGAVIVGVAERTAFSVGVTVSAWVQHFQTWELYLSPFAGFEWAWRPNLIVFLRANFPLHVYEDLPLLGTYLSFGVKVSPW